MQRNITISAAALSIAGVARALRRCNGWLAVLPLPLLLAVTSVGCGSLKQPAAAADPCQSALAGQCGDTCTADGDCPAGVYCGSAGVCTADCAAGAKQCQDGFSCTSKGYCVSNGSSGSGGSAGSAGADGAGGVIFFDAGAFDATMPPLQDGGACAAETRRGEQIPLDMFIMFDRSGSMNEDVAGGKKWPLVTQALGSFVNDPQSSGIGVGIQFFALPLNGVLDDNNFSCDIADYAKAAVPVAPLPGNAAPVMAAVNALSPSGRTPTRVALLGAIQYAQQYALTQPTHKVIVVLATDGEPNVCDSTIQAVVDVAAQGLITLPRMETYVVGVGKSTQNLNDIAVAGGTAKALIVDTAQNTTQQFIDAMNAIRGTALVPCEFQIPAAQGTSKLDYDKVNVDYTPGGATDPIHLARAADAASCDPAFGGWFYDNPTQPTKIELCPTSCSTVKGDRMGQVDVLLGCRTVVVTPH